MRCVIFALLCTSCALDPDIIAALEDVSGDDAGGPVHSVDSGSPTAKDAAGLAHVNDAKVALDAGAGPFCDGVESRLLFIDEQGGVSWVGRDASTPTGGGTADCLANGVQALAIDGRGTIWASAADGSNWTVDPSLSCKQSPIPASPQSWAFIYRPELRSEWLYTLQGGALIAYDVMHSYEPRKLAASSARLLAGTSTGLLYALEADTQTITVFAIDPDTGTATLHAKFANPEPVVPHGGAIWDARLMLMLGRTLYAFELTLESSAAFLELPAEHLAATALGASWCASAK